MAADTTARYTAWLAERGIHVEGLQLHTFEREGRYGRTRWARGRAAASLIRSPAALLP